MYEYYTILGSPPSLVQRLKKIQNVLSKIMNSNDFLWILGFHIIGSQIIDRWILYTKSRKKV